jgi:hypothetical protein
VTEKESKEIKPGRGGAREGAGRPPGAPNKLTRPLKELAAQYTEDSIHTLVTLRDHAESEQVRLQAANALLDRGHGRPRQELDVTRHEGVTVIVQRQTAPVLDAQPAASLRGELPALMDNSAYDGESCEAS